MLMLVMFFGGLSLDGRGQVIASFVPPVSAVVMPKRILAGGVEWWEPLLALGLLAAFAGGHRVGGGAALPPGPAADRRPGQPAPGVVRGRVTRRQVGRGTSEQVHQGRGPRHHRPEPQAAPGQAGQPGRSRTAPAASRRARP